MDLYILHLDMPTKKTSAEQFVFGKQAFRMATPGEWSVRVVFLNFVFSHSSVSLKSSSWPHITFIVKTKVWRRVRNYFDAAMISFSSHFEGEKSEFYNIIEEVK